MASPNTEEELQKFIERPKFDAPAWQRRMLNPSSSDVCQRMEAILNQMAEQLSALVHSNASPATLRRTIASSLGSVSTLEFDTEEREFLCDEVERLAGIVNVKVGNTLNRWHYGLFLGTLINVFRGTPKN